MTRNLNRLPPTPERRIPQLGSIRIPARIDRAHTFLSLAQSSRLLCMLEYHHVPIPTPHRPAGPQPGFVPDDPKGDSLTVNQELLHHGVVVGSFDYPGGGMRRQCTEPGCEPGDNLFFFRHSSRIAKWRSPRLSPERGRFCNLEAKELWSRIELRRRSFRELLEDSVCLVLAP